MKKEDLEKLNPKLASVRTKIGDLLKEEGLDDFELKSILFDRKEKHCPNGYEPVEVPVPGGFVTQCLPITHKLIKKDNQDL